MLSDYPLESKRCRQFPANPARGLRGFVGNLFLGMLKKAILRANTAGNAGLEGCFILNVRKGIFLTSLFQQLVCTPPLFPQIPHPRFSRFSYATLHPTRP